jgi:hypothetical protein
MSFWEAEIRNDQQHLSSYRALLESVSELFSTCTYELMWNSNVIEEDAFIIALEEHLEKAGKEKDYPISTLVLDLDVLAEKKHDDIENDDSEYSSSSDDGVLHPNAYQMEQKTGKWTIAEKIRLREDNLICLQMILY